MRATDCPEFSTCSGPAPFCGPKIRAASRKPTVTSHATRTSAPLRPPDSSIAFSAPRPPSVVAEPPTPTRICVAPHDKAATMSSPVPRDVAARGSLPSVPPARTSPDALADSTTARCPTRRQSASTGSPSGPVTTSLSSSPPTTLSTSRKPSPPSDIGHESASQPAFVAPSAIPAAISAAVAVPLNASGATSTDLGTPERDGSCVPAMTGQSWPLQHSGCSVA